MFCPNCGTENREDAIYCSLCQEPLQRYTQESAAGGSQAGAGAAAGASPAAPASSGVSPGMWRPEMAPAPQTVIPPGGGIPPHHGPSYAPYPGAAPYASSPYYPASPVMMMQRTPGEATAALVLGILGLVMCPIIFSLLAIIFGKKALNMIDASGGYLGGRSQAQAGYIMGIIGMAIYTIVVFIYIILAVVAASSSSMMFPA